ncbi:MAG: hypothetical protein ACPL07_00365 [Candidatus Bathyarchaeia archaeon]
MQRFISILWGFKALVGQAEICFIQSPHRSSLKGRSGLRSVEDNTAPNLILRPYSFEIRRVFLPLYPKPELIVEGFR